MKVVIFSENDWNSPLKYQRHHLAEFFSKQEDVEKVFFYSKASIRKLKIKDFFYVIKEKLFPNKKTKKSKRNCPKKIEVVNFILFPYQRSFKILNKFLQKKVFSDLETRINDWSDTVFITYQPIPECLQIIENYKPFKSVYISVHDYQNMYGVGKEVVEVEKELIKKVNLFTTDSEYLFKKLSSLDKRSVPLTPACPKSVVDKSINEDRQVKDIKSVIYFGTIANYLDLSLLKTLTQNNIQVDFLGKEYDVNVKKLNFQIEPKLYSPVDFEEGSEILKSYDGMILPYKVNDRNDLIIPAKIFECFSLGMPVFVPNMKWTNEAEINGNVYRYENAEDLLQKFKTFNLEDFQKDRRRMLEVAKNNTWDVRFEKLYKWIK